MNDYPHLLEIPTRWHDNDVYGHVNNVTYYSYFDTVANHFLISEGGLDIHTSEVTGAKVRSATGIAYVSFKVKVGATRPVMTAVR